jgi:predicted Zn-dependent protease
MNGVTRREALSGLCWCSALALAGCAGAVPQGRVEPGYKPALATDEGGLWQQVAKTEDEVKHSHQRVLDPALNAYVSDIVCQLAGSNCPDVRTYIQRTPYFNANMAPNGMMRVWTGLFLRTHNEAQLAAVLGHEIGHYLERHTLQRWRDTRNTTDFAAVMGLGGIYTLPVTLAAVSTLYGFSRDQERRADEIGLELMTKAGYAPIEASKLWEQLIAEQAADKDKPERSVFFATHPTHEERMRTLREKAEATPAAGAQSFAERYRRQLAGMRGQFLQDDLKLREYDRSIVLMQQIAAADGEDGELAYFSGEIYRLRDKGDDGATARAAFERALGLPNCPPETYRSLGLVQLRTGEAGKANVSFARYLELRPDATDREMIRSYMVKQTS